MEDVVLVRLLLLLVLVFILYIWITTTTTPTTTSNAQDDRSRAIVQLKPLVHTIVVVGAARDIAKHWKQGVANTIESLCMYGQHAFVYLYENDSTDGTPECLEEWARSMLSKHGCIRVHCMLRQVNNDPSRTKRIAKARNTLLARIRKDFASVPSSSSSSSSTFSFLSSSSYVVCLDLDDVNSQGRIADTFPSAWAFLQRHSEDCMGVFPVQFNHSYYDLWALRMESVLTYDCWKAVEMDGGNQDLHVLQKGQEMSRRIAQGRPLMVQSAFCGAACYPLSVWVQSPASVQYNGDETCEHVSFHTQLSQWCPTKRFYILPYWYTDQRSS